MKRSTLVVAVILGGIVAIIVFALVLEVSSGPTFRAEEHDSYRECVRAIPAEWGPGSFERSGAEDACRYVHGVR